MEEEKHTNFVTHVFNFDEPSKHLIMNAVQYTIFSVFLVMVYHRFLEDYEVTVDENKGNITLMMEVCLECLIWILGILFMHRIITYFPTLSKTEYGQINLTTMILPSVCVLLLLSKCKDKVKLVMDRLLSTPPVVKKTQANVQSSMQSSIPPLPIVPTQRDEPETTFEPMQGSFAGTAF